MDFQDDEMDFWSLDRLVAEISDGNYVHDLFAIGQKDESLTMLQRLGAGNTVQQNRTADVHNLSEPPRRDRIDEKMIPVQQFIPNSSKTDIASMLHKAIEYIMYLALQRCKVEQLGMVHQRSSKVGNMEVMNYGVNENGNHYWSGMREAQVEDTDSEPENARKVITLRQKQFCIQMVPMILSYSKQLHRTLSTHKSSRKGF
ncbi:hypothetical protein CY35_06G129100 [Sphagnum magellanicum]|nr:hypothetical protein CY35_06G129100 [Sphagnum magellanicum]